MTSQVVSSTHNEKEKSIQSASSKSELLSKQAELFRSKLIEKFYLLDKRNEAADTARPKYYVNQVAEPGGMDMMMREGPDALVRFRVNTLGRKHQITYAERRMNRITNKTSKRPPLDMWAHWVVNSEWFQNLIMILIVIDAIVLGIIGELEDVQDMDISVMRTILYIFDYCSLGVFIIEIALKWIDNFPHYWKSGGNIFDFVVTALSFLPEMVGMITGDTKGSPLAVIGNILRVFRILRTLKVVTRFGQVRVIALAVTKSFEDMFYISIVLLTFIYFYAIVGVTLFRNHSKSQNPHLLYRESFSNIVKAMVTLFQIMTLDAWGDIVDDINIICHPILAICYIILWLFVGCFIFANLFVGIMVNNFQDIRSDLSEEVRELVEKQEENIKLERLNEDLGSHEQFNNQRREEMLQEQNEQKEVIQSNWLNEEVVTTKPQEHHIEDRIKLEQDPDKEQEPQIKDRIKREQDSVNKAEHERDPVDKRKQEQNTPVEEYENIVSQHMLNITQSGDDWQKTLMDSMNSISKTATNTTWPRDTLFAYFLFMERMEENLEEREQLLRLAAKALLRIHDN